MATPQYILAATAFPAPGESLRLRQFFDTEQGPVSQLLENPPTTRRASFGLTTLDRARVVNNEYLEVRSGDRKTIHAYPDGRLVFKASGAGDFLAWPLEREFPARPIVDPTVVADSIVSFVRFYRALIPLFVRVPGPVQFRVELRDAFFDGSKLRFYAGPSREMSRVAGIIGNVAREQNPADGVYVSLTELKDTPDVVAYRIVEKFYQFFDLGPDDIPYTSGSGEKRAIEISSFHVI